MKEIEQSRQGEIEASERFLLLILSLKLAARPLGAKSNENIGPLGQLIFLQSILPSSKFELNTVHLY